jgi:hypothetical protein
VRRIRRDRSRLRHGRPAVLRAPAARPEKPFRQWDWSSRRLLKRTEHASTLIVGGPPWSLLALGDTITRAADRLADLPSHHRRHQNHLIDLAAMFGGDHSSPHGFDIVSHDPSCNR